MILDVLRHRIILTYEAEAQAVTTDAIIKKVFNAVLEKWLLSVQLTN